MPSSAVQTLLASRQDGSQLHRIVVRVGAAAAWVATAVYLVAGAFTGDASMFLEAIGPALAATLMTAQVLAGREDGRLALLGSGVVVMVWYTLFGDAGTTVPAAVAMVVIAALGMLFVTARREVVTATVAAVLFVTPFMWDLELDDQIVLGSVMALSFVMTHFIMASIQSTSLALNARYQILFEESPTAVLEEDWSEALEYVVAEYSGKPDRLKQFLMAYPAVVETAVSKAKVLRANDAALRLLDVDDPGRLLGYRRRSSVTDETIETFVSALVSLFEGDRVWEHETSRRRRSGEIQWLQMRSVDTSTAVPASSIVIVLADTTHVRARSEAMADMVRAKDEFIASVSHELRTPLTAVIGLTSAMADNPGMGPDERAELLELVTDQAGEMANIVEDLLVAARAEMGTVAIQIEEVDLAAEVKSTIDGLGMFVELPKKSPPPVAADPRRVRQILRNLLTNAQRYGGPGRRISCGSSAYGAWVEVRDNGPGLPEDEAAHIFEPYVTGQSGAHGSVGLGLAVARQLAELMGGSLVYERSGLETVFRLQLPLAERQGAILASQSHVG